MKVLCPQCERMVDLERFRVEGGVLHVTCVRCGADTEVRPSADAVAASVPQATVEAPGSADEAASGPHLGSGARVAGGASAPAAASPRVLPEAPRSSSPLVESSPPPPSGSPSPATARAPESTPSRPPSQPPRVSLTSSPAASNVVMLRTATVDAVERAAKSAEGDPFEVPPGFCPKCIARRDGSSSCPQCGVQFDTFVAANVAPPAWLCEAWVSLLRGWGDEGAHEALRQRAQREDMLGALGRLYRLRLASEPNDPIAEKGRTDVLRLASAAMSYRPRSDEAQGPSRVKTVVAAVAVFFAVGAVGLLIRFLMMRVP
ncbi:MAG: hypothetical protein AB1938_07055 [Myxococcota bacterium]